MQAPDLVGGIAGGINAQDVGGAIFIDFDARAAQLRRARLHGLRHRHLDQRSFSAVAFGFKEIGQGFLVGAEGGEKMLEVAAA